MMQRMTRSATAKAAAAKAAAKTPVTPPAKATVKTPAKTPAKTPPKSPVKTPVAKVGTPKTPTTPKPPPAGHIRVRLDANGKVHYWGTDKAAARSTYAGSYFDVPAADFATWKGAGKRTASNKHTDPDSGKSYIKEGTQFYEYDRSKDDRKGAAVTPPPGLIDRSRGDRESKPLEPFDIGPYAKAVKLGGRTYKALPDVKGAWPADKDHVPSGESLRRRNDGNAWEEEAYKTGWTIAIHSDMHKTESPTYKGSQKTWDTMKPEERRRVEQDTKFPAGAFHRDAFHMLDATAGKDYSVSGNPVTATLDLGKRENALRAHGAYRALYRKNVKMFAPATDFKGKRGVNPLEHGHTYTHQPKKPSKSGRTVGKFTYSPGPLGVNQGTLIAQGFRERLLKIPGVQKP